MKDEKRPQSERDKPRPVSNKVVLCFDGTGNEMDAYETNVLKLYQTIDQCEQQKTYYQAGIGTYVASNTSLPVPKFIVNAMLTANKALGGYGLTLLDLAEHIQSAYLWLCNTYKPGDEIFIFGFSRGAYTARCIASMILTVGILDPGLNALVPKAFDCYIQSRGHTPPASCPNAKRFRRSANQIKEITFLGIWDTVSSIANAQESSMPATDVLLRVKTIAHAVALDERRKQFNVEHVKHLEPRWLEKQMALNPEHEREHGQPQLNLPNSRPALYEYWFAGVHSEVGGGNVAETGPCSHDDIGLIGKAFRLAGSVVKKASTIILGGTFADPPAHPQTDTDTEETPAARRIKPYKPNPANIPLRWMLKKAHDAGLCFSIDAITGYHDDEAHEYHIDEAPFYRHLLPALEARFSEGKAPEKPRGGDDEEYWEIYRDGKAIWDQTRVAWIINHGAKLDCAQWVDFRGGGMENAWSTTELEAVSHVREDLVAPIDSEPSFMKQGWMMRAFYDWIPPYKGRTRRLDLARHLLTPNTLQPFTVIGILSNLLPPFGDAPPRRFVCDKSLDHVGGHQEDSDIRWRKQFRKVHPSVIARIRMTRDTENPYFPAAIGFKINDKPETEDLTFFSSLTEWTTDSLTQLGIFSRKIPAYDPASPLVGFTPEEIGHQNFDEDEQNFPNEEGETRISTDATES
ncbi:DUF2235 domain-containing protein [Pseudohyphozyma bogoriensis]|nr:DUF2235 domain-containing protein [Pseudohyphozyma bogoriensis]